MHVIVRLAIALVSITVATFGAFGLPFTSDTGSNKNTATSNAVVTQAVLPSVASAKIIAPPQVVSISPTDGSQEVMLDIEDPIVVRFDTSVKDFFVDFRLEPSIALMYENNPEKTEFKLLPKEPLRLGTSYTINVFMKRRGMDDDAYQKIAVSQFITAKETLTPAQQTVAHILTTAEQNLVPQITQGRYIDISLTDQVMVLVEDGKALDAYRISSGKRGMETPKGQFKIENKARKPWSKQYGLFMPYWMALVPSGKFGIHELPEWPSGYKEGANHLGIPVSHGCVRIGVGPAKRVWDFADIGTPVIVH